VCDEALDVEHVHQAAVDLHGAAALREQHLEAKKHLQVPHSVALV
jgi:hypothetical protein